MCGARRGRQWPGRHPACRLGLICVFRVALQIRGRVRPRGPAAGQQSKDKGRSCGQTAATFWGRLAVPARDACKPDLGTFLGSLGFAFSSDGSFILTEKGRESWQGSHVSLVCTATFPLSARTGDRARAREKESWSERGCARARTQISPRGYSNAHRTD